MSWETRLRQGAYTSPSGRRVEFEFVDVARETLKRTVGFQFPGLDGAYVQDNGFGARSYPLRCIFTGPNCDIEATQFEAALLERGVGRLEHPLYGTFDVVPFETITRQEDLVRSGNQSIVEVTFWTSIRELYPSSSIATANEIFAMADQVAVASSAQFEASVDISSVVLQADLLATYDNSISSINAMLQPIANGMSATRARFEAVRQVVVRSANQLISLPFGMAFQAAEMVSLPARDAKSFAVTFEAYMALLEGTLAALPANPWLSPAPPGSRAERARNNAFFVSDATACSIVMAVGVAATSCTYQTRNDAMAAAGSLLTLFDTVIAWRDRCYATIDKVDTGEAYVSLRDMTAAVVSFLVNLAFDLMVERRVTLTRPRALLELCAELYGGVDEYLDLFISTNGFLPDELIELPRGREVIFYA